VLQPQDKADRGIHLGEAIAAPQINRAIASTSIQKTCSENGAHFGQSTLMLIAQHGG
jgi:hypothetical protein